MSTLARSAVHERKSHAKAQEATALLRADHRAVSKLFAEYEFEKDVTEKRKLADQICIELTVHALIEEEIFYPAVKEALKDAELVPQALIEHASMKQLIAQIEEAETDGEIFNAKVKVLSEYVKHHVKEEQDKIFKQAKASDLDLTELGAKLATKKAELMANLPQLKGVG